MLQKHREPDSSADEQLQAVLPEQAHAQGRASVVGHWVPERVLHALCAYALQWNPHVAWPSLRKLLVIIHQVMQDLHRWCRVC